MKLEHVALNVPDPAAISKWWAENLGMEIVLANDEAPYMHFIADSARQSMLELYNNPAAEMPDYGSISSVNLHIAFTANDIEADRERLIAAGATAEGEINDLPASFARLAFLRDPWNIPFQLVERSKSLI